MDGGLIPAFLVGGPAAADPMLLIGAVALDLAIGDPSYPLHPVRLMGWTLSRLESLLRAVRMDGYVGGAVLFVLLSVIWVAGLTWAVAAATTLSPWAGLALHFFLLYSLLALGDLLHHVWRVERPLASGDLQASRAAIARLVGRDTTMMDAAACRRAAVESLSENLTDGYTSPLFWYAALGLPGLVLFKVVSTMDSMVGYRTPRYATFGTCGARLDDVMNFVPARLTWLLVALVSAVLPGCSARKALTVGWQQHAVLLGPNSGWSEAAVAGGIERRIVGPIYLRGALVTDVWIGDPADPPLATRADLVRGVRLVTVTGLVAAFAVLVLLTV